MSAGPLLLVLPLVFRVGPAPPEPDARFVEVRRYLAPEAHQGVAVDAVHFYAIGNRVLAKYRKDTGGRVATWFADDDRPLVHMNAGVVLGDELHVAHSNYPSAPTVGSIEVFDTATLGHVRTESLGVTAGSFTWLDRTGAGPGMAVPNDTGRPPSGWRMFAHYELFDHAGYATGTASTELRRTDRRGRPLEGWVFPAALVAKFRPNSCSGGAWGPDGKLYVTGHDEPEVYRLRLPAAGSELVWEATLPAPLRGQGVAWDRGEPGVLYGVDRAAGQVVVMRTAAP